MKIRLGDLRRIIREASRAQSKVTVPVLPKHRKMAEDLFPYPGSTVAKKIVDAYEFYRGEYEFRGLPRGADAVAHWVSQNYVKIDRLTAGGSVEFLGRGYGGDAFVLTSGPNEGRVLKFEPNFYTTGGSSALVGGDVGEPEVFGTGKLPLLGMSDMNVGWTIKERVETIPKEFIGPLEGVMSQLVSMVDGKRPVNLGSVYKEMDPSLKDFFPASLGLDISLVSVGKGSRVPRWLSDLYTTMTRSKSSDMRSVNVGVRRVGKGIQWVFFD